MKMHLLRRTVAAVALVLTLVTAVSAHSGDHIAFYDVSVDAGLRLHPGGRDARRKFGGASVADLDGDGHADILIGHHDDGPCDVYFNRGNMTFERSDWDLWYDIHGLNPFRISPWNHAMHFVMSRGGAFGTSPRLPIILRVGSDRRITDVTEEIGVDTVGVKGRGRSALPLNLKLGNWYFTDIIFTNAPMGSFDEVHHSAFEGRERQKIRRRTLHGFVRDPNQYASVIDVDGDGTMEIISYSEVRIYRMVKSFSCSDISSLVLPADLDLSGTIAVAELDYDNDGKWDLYIARTNVAEFSWLPSSDSDDRLLRNVGGRFVDISREAGIPRGTQSRGVTVGDFDNDGFVDLIVPQYDKPDLLLHNQGGRAFSVRNAGFKRSSHTHGDMVTAVDLDKDGRLDVVLSEGDWHHKEYGGRLRIMKNVGTSLGRSLLVRVYNAPTQLATSLHAVVTVKTWSGRQFVRRVGSPGTAVSNSYIELLHFGIGREWSVKRVTARWIDGSRQSVYNVSAGSTLELGKS